MTVNLVSVSTGEILGTMALKGDHVVTSDKTVDRIFNSLKKAYRDNPPTDAVILAVFADGWSNGYVKTIKA